MLLFYGVRRGEAGVEQSSQPREGFEVDVGLSGDRVA
jgi:hypothetical protein